MFTEARLKLTAWYLGIIMMISMLFSMVIYHNIDTEFRRFERIHEIVEMESGRIPAQFNQLRNPSADRFEPEAIRAARTRVISALFMINLTILILAGTAGYFLAGRTLEPIARMVDEQYRFISDASHELRTPLTALKSMLEVNLRDTKLTVSEAKTALRSSIEEVNTLQALSDSLLTLAQYQKSKRFVRPEIIRIQDVVDDAIRQVSRLAQNKKITIREHKSEGKVRGNRINLTELFVILLDNSIKYSPPSGSVTVLVRHMKKHIMVTVADTGIGISKKDIPFIFDRFWRADTSRSKNSSDGYGLGLAIAKQIAEHHDGVISVESKEGSGSRFTVSLPSA